MSSDEAPELSAWLEVLELSQGKMVRDWLGWAV